MKKHLTFYFFLTVSALIIFWLVIYSGNRAYSNQNIFETFSGIKNGTWTFFRDVFSNLHNTLGVLLLQIVVIIIVARLMGYLFQKMEQPVVIGEILAGILLGPSVLGFVSPSTMNFIFPADSLGNLYLLSQVGLILFMFVIGMELDWESLRKSAKDAILISYTGLILPFILGILLSYFLYNFLSPGKSSFTAFALFMGTALCITAFPVLARIIQEKQLTRSPVGKIAITAAAIGDAAAWCILAVVIAFVRAGAFTPALITISLSIVYVIVMLYVIRPFVQRIGAIYSTRENISKPIVAFVFLLMVFSAFLSEVIGIHALFGAFMAGVIMPNNLNFKQVITEKIQDLALVLLLPLFFVETGLRTEVGLIATPSLWLVCAGIIGIAILGKFGGTLLASRYAGHSWNHSLTLGVLMNSKGLMELVVINIGYELGILSPEIYSMLVIMTLVTTFITGPGLSILGYVYRDKTKKEIHSKTGKVMLSFANPRMGSTLLKIGRSIVSDKAADTEYLAVHISPRTDISPADAAVFEKESFAPVLKTAVNMKIPLRTIYKNIGGDVSNEIIGICQAEKPDFLMLGGAYSIFSSDLLGGIIRKILNEVNCDVLVFNERQKFQLDSMLLVFFGNGDDFLLSYAFDMKKETHQKCYIFPARNSVTTIETFNKKTGFSPEIIRSRFTDPSLLESIDLVLVTTENWKLVESTYPSLIKHFPSVLYLHKGSLPNRLLTSNAIQPRLRYNANDKSNLIQTD
jgi:Kef-type K+ transport system membrane component KefB/nucleotide-binding universal stress UspA family protein